MAVLGYDRAGDGPLLVLVHGFPFDRRLWAHQLGDLSRIRTVVAPDLRGRGLSPATGNDDWTIDDHADDVARTIESLGAAPADVGGLSMGGYVVFALLRRHPGLVRSVLLMSTRAEADAPEARAVREQQAPLVREQGAQALAEGMIPRLVGTDAGDDVRADLWEMFRDTPGRTAAADLLAMRDRPDSTPDLAGIGVPALVLHGEADQVVPLDAAMAMAAGIPGARFASVAGGGHVTPLEKPEVANAVIGAFLGRLDGPG